MYLGEGAKALSGRASDGIILVKISEEGVFKRSHNLKR